MNKRLKQLLESTQIGGRYTCLLDTYNQAIYTDFAPTISTRVDASNNTYIMEVKVVGQCWKSLQNGMVYDTEGISPIILSGCHSGVEPKIMEPKIIKKGNYSPSNHNASSIVSGEGIAPAVMENHGTVTAIRVPQATKQGYIEVEPGGVFDGAYPESTTRRGRVQEGGKVAPTLCTSNELSVYEGVKNQEFRIRKLTPRECFRLMGVSEENIDTIQAAGISNSQQYKMAGNSIVVDVLYYIFKKMFIDKENDNTLLTLF